MLPLTRCGGDSHSSVASFIADLLGPLYGVTQGPVQETSLWLCDTQAVTSAAPRDRLFGCLQVTRYRAPDWRLRVESASSRNFCSRPLV